MNTEILALSLLLSAPIIGVGYWWYKKNRPIHTLNLWDFGTGTVQPRRIRNIHGPFHVKIGKGQKMLIPVPEGYSCPRQDGKGIMFHADQSTGQLFKPMRGNDVGVNFNFASGLYTELALADGRERKAAEATNGGQGITLMHILVALGVVAALVCIVIYQFAKSGGI